ncbi:MAG: DUF3014 domain-containing protein [Halioglobus sp.]|nr:DUF3014 domain-containing protein [Halioglobus sp.]
MQPRAEDRLSETPPRRGRPTWLLIAAVVVIAVGLFLYQSGQEQQAPPVEEPPAPEAAVAPEPPLPPAPDIPEPAPTPAPAAAAPEAPTEPPLTLEDSDPILRETLAEAGTAGVLVTALEQDHIAERGVSLIDGFSRGKVLRKLLPLEPPQAPFSIAERPDGLFIDPASYRRYDDYAQAIAELDTQQLVDSFHRFRPLLEQAYAGLGYKAGDFDNALIRMLDRILATPEITEPIAVRKVEAVYQFRDPKLEQLTALQKQLLRTGPDNVAIVKQKAAQLRDGLLGPQ